MNRLGNQTSPYLLQHRHNPVDWWPWGADALAAARREGKPILLSVGYAACHWCHVMAHESFEDPGTAAVMNELFVNIKVDREERPDVDQIYMQALHMLGEQGGWPLTMFLTPDGEPFWGGTYFPKTARFGRPSFVAVLREVARLVREEPGRIAHNRNALLQNLRATVAASPDASLGEKWLLEVGSALKRAFDPVHGGLKGAPKFPNPMLLEFLWRHAVSSHDTEAMALFQLSMEQMARGGIHDHLGGGFARYSVDDRWLVPHFEKMLYDNAQLLPLFALAAVKTGSALCREAAEGIVAWLNREMRLPGGVFAASLDADSEGEEGKAYVWSEAEIDELLGAESALFKTVYGVTQEGNWEGSTILNRQNRVMVDPAKEAQLGRLRDRLLEHRNKRVQPGRDDKVLADWNGLMIIGLVRAGLLLDRPDWVQAAQETYRFIRESMVRDGLLGHSWRDDRLLFPGFATDHAAMMLAAVTLYEASGTRHYLEDASRWRDLLRDHYADESGVLYLVSDSADDLVIRPRQTTDEATPNANGLFGESLARLAALSYGTPDEELSRLAGYAKVAPLNHASILNALDFYLHGAAVIVAGSEREALLAAARSVPYPNRTIMDLKDAGDLHADHPARTQAERAGLGSAFVCQGQSCSLPISDAALLRQTLRSSLDKTE
ncbi:MULTISPECIES: thioredoxin domain-containing protein [unclassified Chelatococcus]|uniref:thioredoxin domain-containing protein n=1 Tax=unclassified Chelatococcus TaxID=2638111 RepID=UPI001BCD83D2|nr:MULTISPECIES: thioredoxin domain-containing protein [unclassified Chelatococcus]MBS7696938.1 thioredoxin domain-containing protein [Chelatococcus sp. YT9]MBX3555928.1 thioredoxin domain-containing protein [Chelatococcus sp.]